MTIAGRTYSVALTCSVLFIAGAAGGAQQSSPGAQGGQQRTGQEQPRQLKLPDKVTNLQVLPKEMEPKQVVQVMRGFTRALGVRCDNCHVGTDTDTPDFASDAKAHKKIAREMIRMVTSINNDHLATLPMEEGKQAPRISCWTCHRGHEEPELVAPLREPQPGNM